MRIPIYIFVGDWGASGVVSWAYRVRDIYADDRKYEARIVCLSKRRPIQIKYDDHLTSLDELESIIPKNRPSISITNGVWEIVPPIVKLIDEGYPIYPLGFCRAFSDDEYFIPLKGLESIFPSIISVSKECTEELKRILPHRPERRIYTRPTGIIRPTKNPFEIPSKIAHFVYTGRFHRIQKRIQDFILLLKALDKTSIDYQFHFYGSGSDQGLLEEGIAKQVESGRAIIHGRLSPDKINEAYTNKHFFVQLSEYEGTSNSMLEAMSHGLIPLVTNTGSGVDGLLEEGVNGHMVEIGAPEKLASLSEALLENPKQMKKMSRRAYKTTRAFGMRRYKKDFSKALNQYLKKGFNADFPLTVDSIQQLDYCRPVIFKP